MTSRFPPKSWENCYVTATRLSAAFRKPILFRILGLGRRLVKTRLYNCRTKFFSQATFKNRSSTQFTLKILRIQRILVPPDPAQLHRSSWLPNVRLTRTKKAPSPSTALLYTFSRQIILRTPQLDGRTASL